MACVTTILLCCCSGKTATIKHMNECGCGQTKLYLNKQWGHLTTDYTLLTFKLEDLNISISSTFKNTCTGAPGWFLSRFHVAYYSSIWKRPQACYKITNYSGLGALWVLNSPNLSTGIYQVLMCQALCKVL